MAIVTGIYRGKPVTIVESFTDLKERYHTIKTRDGMLVVLAEEVAVSCINGVKVREDSRSVELEAEE